MDPTIEARIKANKDWQIFIELNQNKANIVFGLCASTNSTSMVTQEVLLRYLTMPWVAAPPIVFLILIAIAYQTIMDKILSLIRLTDDQKEKDKITDEKKAKIELTKNQKENIKFFLLILASIFLLSFGYYILPIGLLLFSASYFINYNLQFNKLGETVIKLFVTMDKDYNLSWAEGFKKNKSDDGVETEFTENHFRILNAGCVLSVFYVIAVVGVFGKWVFPIILALSSPWIVIPACIFMGIILALFGIIYGLLAARSWASLLHLDAKLKEQYNGDGIFSINALAIFCKTLVTGFKAYWANAWEGCLYLALNILDILLDSSWNKKWAALKDSLRIIATAVIEIVLLCVKFIQVFLVLLFVPIFAAMEGVLSSGGDTVGNGISEEILKGPYGKQIGNITSEIITYGAMVANTPFAMKTAASALLAEEIIPNVSFWEKINEFRIRIFGQLLNAAAVAGQSNDGQVPSEQAEFVKVGGLATLSLTAGNEAVSNFTKKSTLLTKWEDKTSTSTSPTTTASVSSALTSVQVNHAHVPGNAQTFG
ncbi:MAG: hypothetical protein WC748_07745 [Legionellales bacterium]